MTERLALEVSLLNFAMWEDEMIYHELSEGLNPWVFTTEHRED